MNSVAGNVTVDKKKTSVAGPSMELEKKLATMEEEGKLINNI